jgi:N-acetylneuraminate synthase
MFKNPYFIAEIGVNHEAKIKLAKKLIKDAKDGGANAIKLQCYKAEKIASKYAKAYWDKKEEIENNQLKLYKRFDKFNEKDYLNLFKYCKKIKIDFIVTPFDLEIVNFFSNKVKYFKISSSDLTNHLLIEKIAQTKVPIILSTGASTIPEISSAIKLIKKYHKKITLLHCILNYPTEKINSNLNMIDDLKKKFGLPVGLSDHTRPKDSIEILSIAHIKKISMIEKHFTNDKKKPGNDHFHSFDKIDLKNYYKKINYLNKVLGSSKKTFLESEKIPRKNARRSLFFNKNINKGNKVKKDDLIALRPAIGISPSKYKSVINKKLKINVKEGQIIKKNLFF